MFVVSIVLGDKSLKYRIMMRMHRNEDNRLSMAAMVLCYCIKAKLSGSCFKGRAL